MRYPHLFKPMQLNQLTLRNRIVSTAHAEVYAEPGGLPGDRPLLRRKGEGRRGPRDLRRVGRCRSTARRAGGNR